MGQLLEHSGTSLVKSSFKKRAVGDKKFQIFGVFSRCPSPHVEHIMLGLVGSLSGEVE